MIARLFGRVPRLTACAGNGEMSCLGKRLGRQSLHDLLLGLGDKFTPPCILITGIGAAYDDEPDADYLVQDDERIRYLEAPRSGGGKARAAGVPIDGYLLWSLLDNFEWAEGYAKRFGTARVNSETHRRIPEASARWYADVIRAST